MKRKRTKKNLDLSTPIKAFAEGGVTAPGISIEITTFGEYNKYCWFEGKTKVMIGPKEALQLIKELQEAIVDDLYNIDPIGDKSRKKIRQEVFAEHGWHSDV